MAKVKLPPLPELEPKGSIATYLSQVRQKRADEQIMNPFGRCYLQDAECVARWHRPLKTTNLQLRTTIGAN